MLPDPPASGLGRWRRPALLICLGTVAAVVALRSPFGIDYDNDAQPAIDALREGRFQDAFAQQPLMGSFSVAIRAPFAELSELFDDESPLLEYRLGAVPCLLVGAALAWWLWERMTTAERPASVRAAVAALIVINPMVFFALESGHPEEVLGAALCVAAVLAAGHRRAVLAGVFLGLAIATKYWAVVAVVPALLALPAQKRRDAALVGGALGLALLAPFALGAPERFRDLMESIAQLDAPAFSFSVWWPFASTPAGGAVGPAYVPDAVEMLSHPLIVFAPVPLGLLYARRSDRPWEQALLLLALVLLLRCVLDPVDNGYYHVPFLFALVSYEALQARGFPKASIIASAVLWLDVNHIWADGHRDLANAIYLAWALPTLAWMAMTLWPALRPRRRVQSLNSAFNP
jgi:hypothetical protein